MGWHFSHAMSTAGILTKLRSYSHSKDPQQRHLNSLPTNVSTKLIEDRIRKCNDLLGRAGYIFQAKARAFDGVLPPITGWPRHPQAPSESEGGPKIVATSNATVFAEYGEAQPPTTSIRVTLPTMLMHSHASQMESIGATTADFAAFHGYTCIFSRGWREVLILNKSRLHVEGNVRRLQHPLASLTVLVANGLNEEDIATAEEAMHSLCQRLNSSHLVRGQCGLQHLETHLRSALLHWRLWNQESGTPALPRVASPSKKPVSERTQLLHSQCPIVAAYLEATRANSQHAHIVMWEPDVVIAHAPRWLSVHGRAARLLPAFASNPCWRVGPVAYLTKECGGQSLRMAEPAMRFGKLSGASSLASDRSSFAASIIANESVSISLGFSQQVFAMPSVLLSTCEWERQHLLPRLDSCSNYPYVGGFEHRWCECMARASRPIERWTFWKDMYVHLRK